MSGTEKQQSRLKVLIAKGKEQGYLTYAEVNDHLPQDISDPDQVEEIIQMINDLGIQVFEHAPDADELLLTEGDDSTDDIAAAEAAAALAAVETETGRTTDPVRMYMREMGTVELLTREGEIAIAKRIEEGTRDLLSDGRLVALESKATACISSTVATCHEVRPPGDAIAIAIVRIDALKDDVLGHGLEQSEADHRRSNARRHENAIA